MTKEEKLKAIEEYPYLMSFSYEHKNKPNQFTIMTKEKHNYREVTDLIFGNYNSYITQHQSKKVSENNIIKFLNENGIECVNRKFYK
jgi:hypothetical protein